MNTKSFKGDTQVWIEACKKNRRKQELHKMLPFLVFLVVTYLCLWFFDSGFTDWIKSFWK